MRTISSIILFCALENGVVISVLPAELPGKLSASSRDGGPVQRLIDDATFETNQYQTLLRELRVAGLPEQRNVDSWLAWFQSAPPELQKKYDVMKQFQASLWVSLIKLWVATAEPGPIPRLAPDDLDDNSSRIIGFYEGWRLATRDHPSQALAMDMVRRNIDALESAYCIQARIAIAKLVSGEDPLIVDHVADLDGRPPESHRAIRAAFERWYLASVGRFHWSDQEGRFTDEGGKPFVLPGSVEEKGRGGGN